MKNFLEYLYYLSRSCTIYSVHPPFAYDLLSHVFSSGANILKGKKSLLKHILLYPDTKLVKAEDAVKIIENADADEDIFVIESPRRHRGFTEFIENGERVSLSIDIYDFLFFSLNPKLSKEHFVVRWR